MPINPDIRWKPRFQSFDRALVLLREAMERGPAALNQLEKEGAIQRFEYSIELAWKTAKDFLEDSGLVIDPVTPREVLKQAFAAKVISDGQVWIDMLNHRNLLSHTYDCEVFEAAVEALAARYLPAIEQLHEFFVVKNLE
jgi:nucleotidyltransferase substrate binding protein (TIGR01987 family)